MLRLGYEQNKILNFFTLEIFLNFFHVKSTEIVSETLCKTIICSQTTPQNRNCCVHCFMIKTQMILKLKDYKTTKDNLTRLKVIYTLIFNQIVINNPVNET